MHANPSVNIGRPGLRGINRTGSSPEIFTFTEPPPNPYADDNIPTEKEVFLKLLARRIRVSRSAERGMTAEQAAEYAWNRFAWTKRHLWVEALRPVAHRPRALRNPHGLIGEALCDAYLDAWAVEDDSVLKLPSGVGIMIRDNTG